MFWDNNYISGPGQTSDVEILSGRDIEVINKMGLIQLRGGNYRNASKYFEKMVALSPNDSESHYHLGYCYQLQKKYEPALKEYQKSLESNPLNTDALNNSGVIFTNQEKFEDAEKCFNLVLKVKPNNRDALTNLGNLKFRQEEFEKAVDYYLRLQIIGSNDPLVFFNLGNCYYKTEDYEKAIHNFGAALALQPQHLSTIINLGLAYYQLEDFEESLRFFNKALRLSPENALVYFNIANTYKSLEKYETAGLFYKKTIEKDPSIRLAYVYLADVLFESGKSKEAEYYYNIATGDNSSKAISFTNIGLQALRQHHFKEALRYFDIALSVNENIPEIRYNKSHIYLLQGNFEEGWQEYEWRLKRSDYPKRKLKKPFLESHNIKGKSILVTDEQGFGDSIQFVRYLNMLKKEGAHVIFECREKIIPLFESISGFDKLIELKPEEEPCIEYDFHIPLLSLPNYFKTKLATIPGEVPYLFPKPELVGYWNKKIKNDEKFNVGLVWGGSPTNTNDKNRSIGLEKLQPLFKLEGINFYSLQKGQALKQLEKIKVPLTMFDDFDSIPFLDSAAIISNLDLVITVDTSIAHLAGAMGKPVWVLLPFIPDWRWMLWRDDTPWYPTMKLFRQYKPRNWNEAVANVEDELRIISRYKVENNLSLDLLNSPKFGPQKITMDR